MRIVTIMNYPSNNNYDLMCYIWLDRVIKHGADEIIIFYENNKPRIVNYFKSANITLEKRSSVKSLGCDHFNIRFKLATLASLDYEYIFLDSDMYVIHDLDKLWEIRGDKPWIGIDHQRIPKLSDTHRKPFLNSGLQIVSDPEFYNLKEIIKTQRAANYKFLTPGRDQALLSRCFRHIKYDYTHPIIGKEWNSCSVVGKLTWKRGDGWKGYTEGLDDNHKVFINHYWHQHKPWKINCPLHASYKKRVKL